MSAGRGDGGADQHVLLVGRQREQLAGAAGRHQGGRAEAGEVGDVRVEGARVERAIGQ